MSQMNSKTCQHCAGSGVEPNDSTTGRQLKASRQAAGVSQREAAERMGITPTYLCDLELGRRHWSHSLIESFNKAVNHLRKKS
jgi:predicted transcriptional regulator